MSPSGLAWAGSLSPKARWGHRAPPLFSRLGRDAFPFGLVHLHVRMRDPEMPDHGLESFGVGRDVVRVHRWYDHAGIGDFGRITPIFTDDADDAGADLLRELER